MGNKFLIIQPKKSVMKRIFTICTLITLAAVLLVACNKNPGSTAGTKGLSYEDTVGLAQFQDWKFQNERMDASKYSQYASQPVAAAPSPAPARRTTTRRTASSNSGSGSMNSGSNNYAKTTQKKGWSKAAKGAAIGGGAGAVAGAVINKKNRVAGGVIGGVAGAALGYIIGHGQDKKDGRY
jgi:hypothetical protein